MLDSDTTIACRRLIASLMFSGHQESVRALTRDTGGSLLLDTAATDSSAAQHSFDLTDSPLHPSQIIVEPASVLRCTLKMVSSLVIELNIVMTAGRRTR